MQEVQKRLAKIIESGKCIYPKEDEVILYGPLSDTKPTGYCYEIFKPLTEEAIACMAEGYKMTFPKPLQEFYRLTNGLFLFGRQMSIFGAPLWSADYKQPIALAFADGHRTKKCPKERLFFASYGTSPEVQVFFNTSEPADAMKVYAAVYGDNRIVRTWDSFEDWFVSEHDRMLAQYERGEWETVDVVEGILKDFRFKQTF